MLAGAAPALGGALYLGKWLGKAPHPRPGRPRSPSVLSFAALDGQAELLGRDRRALADAAAGRGVGRAAAVA